MVDWSHIGKAIALVGLVLVIGGGLVALLGKLSGSGSGVAWLGRLPGDILIKRESYTFYFPLTSSILISIAITVLAALLSLLKR